MVEKCPFCMIANGDIKADVVYETENVMVFKDLNPVAPTHLLVIPKKEHFPTVDTITDPALWSDLMGAVKDVVSKLGLSEEGYRLVINCGESAGQTVPHLHIHLLSGRYLGWPPG